MSRVRVLGIGSPSGDDQAGWLVVDVLRGYGIDAGKLDRPGATLVSVLADVEHVILVDAMQGGGGPGQIRRFERHDWRGYRQGLSSHGFGVLDALSLAEALGSLPPRLELYGIEIGSADPGTAAGEAVQAAAQKLAARIATSLRETT